MRKQIGALAGIITVLTSCGGGGSDSGGNIATVPPSAPAPAPPPPPTSTAGCSVTERQNWVAGEMDTYYLFPDLLPANRSPAGYSTVQDYIDYLTATARAQGKDRYFTYITSIAEENAYYQSGSNAGIGVRLGLTSDNRLFVTEAFESAPAYAVGIDRGTEIVAIGTSESNLRNVADIYAAEGGNGLNNALGSDEAGVSRYFRIRKVNGSEAVVKVTKASYNLDAVSPRYGSKIIEDGGRKVGYVNLRTFIDNAEAPLRNAFANFRSQGVTEVVIDLRYNGGGLISIADAFGNLLGGGRSASDVFRYTTFRPSLASNNEQTNFKQQSQSISPMKIAFIGRGGTASASELLMNAFIPYLGANAALIGTNTYGKPVGQIARDRPQCDDRLRVVALRTENANRQGDYYNGLANVMKTTCVAADDISFQMGDPREASTKQALDFLAGRGSCTPISTASTARAGTTTLGRSQEVALGQMELLRPQVPSTPQRETPGLY
ncbi:S41 family peptidase [Novosphingopyxis sp. YJ-S2-01]|uniref:S41 family peptidase n=1 Tax=Novosphingopyxis sp. YJ-S2-01 TaxID=2794021 RepID=UPI0018DD91D6|nr:S41 family peptidase [Novosphingopyxis sp. YJ-S2-01]MBH9536903.1 peptidase S41 [Novosphingopyxis sp. YJ-S2-01]